MLCTLNVSDVSTTSKAADSPRNTAYRRSIYLADYPRALGPKASSPTFRRTGRDPSADIRAEKALEGQLQAILRKCVLNLWDELILRRQLSEIELSRYILERNRSADSA
jgi:hypothetical protein